LDSCWGQIPFINSQESPSKSFQTVYLPEKPAYMISTNVVCSLRLDLIRDRINSLLSSVKEISYEFNDVSFKWCGVFINGSKICHFDIQVYPNDPSSDYIVEVNRKKGECCLSHILFRQLKASLSESTSSASSASSTTPTPVSSLAEYSLSDKDIQEALCPILTMAKNAATEIQLEAAKILYSLTCKDDTREQLRESGVATILANLVVSGSCDCTRRNAAFALTNLSESPSCQEAIVDSGVIPELFNNIQRILPDFGN